MPIDTQTRRSPGWWLQRLSKKLVARQGRLELLDSYFRGEPPLPKGAENAKDAYKAFQKKARSNLAELSVEAVRERMNVVGFRTAEATDDLGDDQAKAIWEENGLDIETGDVFQMMLSMGDGYMIVGKDNDTKRPVITSEDPREVVTEHDPTHQRRVVAGMKLFHDDIDDLDLAYLYLPDRARNVCDVHVATRPRRTVGKTGVRFSPASFNWDEQLSGELPGADAPVVRFRNKRAVGEYETHIDLLDRINHMILQRMVIATMQAFRQRAAKNMPTVYPPGHPQAGQEINYDGMFTSDPGALWLLPEAAELWESGVVDLSPILNSVKDDVQEFAAVTRTPLHYFQPSGENQSAEGAALSREALTFRADDRIKRGTPGLISVMSTAFRYLGDEKRADVSKMHVLWAPPDRISLSERASAATQAQAAGVPWRSVMTEIMGFPPDVVKRMESERADDQILAAQVAAAAKAATG